jgi:hypothetical protein
MTFVGTAGSVEFSMTYSAGGKVTFAGSWSCPGTVHA